MKYEEIDFDEDMSKYGYNTYVKTDKLLCGGNLLYSVVKASDNDLTLREFIRACIVERDKCYSNGDVVINDVEYWITSASKHERCIEDIPENLLDMLIDEISGYQEWGYHKHYIIKLKGE